MRISNGDQLGGGGFAELLQLQAEFQTRLSEEVLRYLRRLQGVLEPHAPGTVVQPEGDATLAGSVRPGTTLTLSVEVENRQRVHTVLTPALTPLVANTGVAWFPSASATPPYGFIAPAETVSLTVSVAAPDGLPPGQYRGLLVLRGFGAGGLPVVLDVSTADSAEAPAEQPGEEPAAGPVGTPGGPAR